MFQKNLFAGCDPALTDEKFFEIRCKGKEKKRSHQESDFADYNNIAIFLIAGQIVAAILRKMHCFMES